MNGVLFFFMECARRCSRRFTTRRPQTAGRLAELNRDIEPARSKVPTTFRRLRRLEWLLRVNHGECFRAPMARHKKRIRAQQPAASSKHVAGREQAGVWVKVISSKI